MLEKKQKTFRKAFRVSEDEIAIIKKKMAQIPAKNESEFFRKMVIDGFIIKFESSEELFNIYKLLSACSKNLNQIAKQANINGAIYKKDLENIQREFSNINLKIEDLSNILFNL